jgi:hypothetical protein
MDHIHDDAAIWRNAPLAASADCPPNIKPAIDTRDNNILPVMQYLQMSLKRTVELLLRYS